ncbi:hypothetical protein [Sporosarcina psychrophila]|uniref:hypothetical protein n=1 Tax=Sporosarcina TaxID=1569 RepID=UPI0012E92965
MRQSRIYVHYFYLAIGLNSDLASEERTSNNAIPFIIRGPLKKYRVIAAENFTLSMYYNAQLNKQRMMIYRSEQLRSFSK